MYQLAHSNTVSKRLIKKGCPHVLVTLDPVSRFTCETRFNRPHPGDGVIWYNIAPERSTLDKVNKVPVTGLISSAGTFVVSGVGAALSYGVGAVVSIGGDNSFTDGAYGAGEFLIAEGVVASPGGRWGNEENANFNITTTAQHGYIDNMLDSNYNGMKAREFINGGLQQLGIKDKLTEK